MAGHPHPIGRIQIQNAKRFPQFLIPNSKFLITYIYIIYNNTIRHVLQ